MVTDISDLIKTQNELIKLNDDLENKVQIRTAKLTNALEEIRATNELLELSQQEISRQRDKANNQRDKIHNQSKKIRHSIEYARLFYLL